MSGHLIDFPLRVQAPPSSTRGPGTPLLQELTPVEVQEVAGMVEAQRQAARRLIISSMLPVLVEAWGGLIEAPVAADRSDPAKLRRVELLALALDAALGACPPETRSVVILQLGGEGRP